MNNLKNLDSIPDPRKKIGEENAVNPEKFQKALKVEKSDETDKREKRNRPKKQEELEDEVDETGVSIPVPTGLFKEYMMEDEKKVSILDASAGSKPHMVAKEQQASPTPLSFIPKLNEDAPSSKLSVGIASDTSSAENPLEEKDTALTADQGESAPDNSAPNSSTASVPQSGYQEEIPEISSDDSSTQSTSSDSNESTSNKQVDPEQKENEKKEQKVNSKAPDQKKVNTKNEQVTSSSVKKDAKAVKGKEGIETKEKGIEGARPKTSAPIKERDQASEEKNIPLGTTKNAQDKQTKENRLEDQKDKEPTISSIEGLSTGGDDQQHKDSKNKGDDQEVAAVAGVQSAAPSGIDALKMSPFANIPKDVFELFEKMVGMMQVSKNNGKNITTVKLSMPNSIFDKCELILEHYDTAPNNYNVQFLGNPDAVNKFTRNLAGLEGVIKNSKLNFSIHLLPPRLNKSHSSSVSALEEEESDKQEKDGEE